HCTARIPDIECSGAGKAQHDTGALGTHLQERTIELLLHDFGDWCTEAAGTKRPIAQCDKSCQRHPDESVDQPFRTPDPPHHIVDCIYRLIFAELFVTIAYQIEIVELAERHGDRDRQKATTDAEHSANALGDTFHGHVELRSASSKLARAKPDELAQRN